MGRSAAWLLLLTGNLFAQTPAPPTEPAGRVPLLYSGKPLTVSFRCTDDDIQWAGLQCSEEEPCPIFLELSALEVVGNRLLTAGNIHASAITLYSILLTSDDSGRTWREPFDRLKGASLDHIQFVNFENGWVSGQNLSPLPSDPFFLLTTDGGKSWDRREVFNESRPGAILQFWFDSKTTGSVVVDREQSAEGSRYEMYDTRNGGESWTIRQSSDKMLKLRRGAETTANPEWRVRADAPSKSFRIEKRQGEKWTAIAAFAVSAGACKPSPPKAAEPPPETDEAPAVAPPSDAVDHLVIPGSPPKKPRPKRP